MRCSDREWLAPLVHKEIERVAASCLRGERPQLQAAALVNEAYGRLDVRDRALFFEIAAEAMRTVLSDAPRDKDGPQVSLEEPLVVQPTTARADFAALDKALKALARIDPRKAQVAELRFFAGLT